VAKARGRLSPDPVQAPPRGIWGSGTVRGVTVKGTVEEFSFRNPHGLLMLTAKDASGAEQHWRIETNSPNILRRRGWSDDSIKPGDQVTVEGYPARDGSPSMRVYRVTFPDGRELVGQRPDPTVVPGQD